GGRAPWPAALDPRPPLLPERLRPHLRGQRLLQLRPAPPAERLLLAPQRRRRLPTGGDRRGHHRRPDPAPLSRGRRSRTEGVPTGTPFFVRAFRGSGHGCDRRPAPDRCLGRSHRGAGYNCIIPAPTGEPPCSRAIPASKATTPSSPRP